MIIKDSWDLLNTEILQCRKCPRLVSWREEVARTKRKAYLDWEYWGKPVPGFGDTRAKIFVVGLAPGAHGSNRTGRMFTGDSAGDFLYSALHRAGFANQATSIHRNDGLVLKELFISALCRCVPPGNKPTPEEINTCRPFLIREILLMNNLKGFIALGSQAYSHLISIFKLLYNVRVDVPFGHGVKVSPGSNLPTLIASYHPSRQNTQTGRLTKGMFDSIWDIANELLKD
jgi:uracil-DNA glycosylase family 4